MAATSNVSSNDKPSFNALYRKMTSLAHAGGSYFTHTLALLSLRNDFNSFCGSVEFTEIINDELLGLRDRHSVPPATNNTVILADTQTHILTVTLLRPSSTGIKSQLMYTEDTLLTQSSDYLIANLNTTPISLKLFGLTSATVEGGPPVVSSKGLLTLTKGTSYILEAEKEFPDFAVNTDIAVARLTSKFAVPFVWIVDRQTLNVTMTSASVPALSRVPLAIKLASQFIRQEDLHCLTSRIVEESMEIFANYVLHEQHHIRWAAIQALCLCDFRVGRIHLEQALADPHPHVRNAARRSLDAFQLEV